MKQKIVIIGSLSLLFAVVIYMAWDIFFSNPDPPENPYAFDLGLMQSSDSSMVLYKEIKTFNTGNMSFTGIAVDHLNRIFICGDDQVIIFDSAGKESGAFTVNGDPQCIHVTNDGRIFLGMKDHVEICDTSGKLLQQWESAGEGSLITSLAVSGQDVFIADAGRRIVYHYTDTGKMLKRIGEKDPARGIPGFIIPSPFFDLALGRNNELWVVNSGRHQFEQYNQEGDLMATWGQASLTLEGFCGCCNPSHFAILPNGNFVTAEKGIERVKVYNPDGKLRGVVAGPEDFMEGTIGMDLAVDSKGRIILLDPGKKQVRIFTLKKQEGV
jgi:hypothetical protein